MDRTVTPAVQLKVKKENPPDDRILECASAAGSDVIVSGDQDLLRLGQYDGIRIINITELLGLARAQYRTR